MINMTFSSYILLFNIINSRCGLSNLKSQRVTGQGWLNHLPSVTLKANNGIMLEICVVVMQKPYSVVILEASNGEAEEPQGGVVPPLLLNH